LASQVKPMAEMIKGMILKKAKIGDGLSRMSVTELFIIGIVFFGFVGADAEIVAAGFFEGVEA